MEKNHYEVLGVSKGADLDTIKLAYRNLAKKYHPDLNPGDTTCEKKFKEIAAAYEVLSDPVEKSKYDTWGTTKPRQTSSPFGGDFLGDIFSSWINQRDVFSNVADHARNIQVQLKVNLKEVLTGCTKEVKYQRREMCQACLGSGGKRMSTCPTCGGGGFQESRQRGVTYRMTCSMCRGSGKAVAERCDGCSGNGVGEPSDALVSLKIPPGIWTGQQLRVEGAGESARGSTGSAGHLYVVIVVEDHPLFQRHNNDLIVKVPISYSHLVLGGTIEVPTLQGLVNIEIPSRSGVNSNLRLKGKGLSDINNEHFGDLIVVLDLDVPDNTSEEFNKNILEMAKYEEENPSEKFNQFQKHCSQLKDH